MKKQELINRISLRTNNLETRFHAGSVYIREMEKGVMQNEAVEMLSEAYEEAFGIIREVIYMLNNTRYAGRNKELILDMVEDFEEAFNDMEEVIDSFK